VATSGDFISETGRPGAQTFPAYDGGALPSPANYPQMSGNVDLAPSATTTLLDEITAGLAD
jgi:hypothetical protein